MLNRRQIIAALLAPVAMGLAARPALAETTPEQFLTTIYATYVGKNAKGVSYSAPTRRLRRYFVPEVAKRFATDIAKTPKGEVPRFGGADVFVDAQDFDIASFQAAVTPVDATHATGKVALVDFGKPREITLELVKTIHGWRVADIISNGKRLTALMQP